MQARRADAEHLGDLVAKVVELVTRHDARLHVCQQGRHEVAARQRLLVDAPELVHTLKLRAGTIYISAEPKNFPSFAAYAATEAQAPPEIELSVWLQTVTPEELTYFERFLELCALLTVNRNAENTPHIQKLLPYDLVQVAAASSR